jgi:poly-beta-1,6-N-acetyl-D-glucosamine synthase
MQKTQIGERRRRGQAGEHRLYTFTVGICATGHPPPLQPLLETVLSGEVPGSLLNQVVLVASDCTDETLRVARRMAASDSRLKLIEHEKRTGKADAINEIFRHTEGDFLVYVNADALIGADSIPILLKSIEEDDGIGFVSGKPVFAMPKGVISDVLDVMWTSFNLLSSDPNQSKQINDGAYIAGRIREKGFRIAFQPEAVVQIDVPRRMIDLVRQRRRILFGHIQVKRLLGKAPRTVETMMFFSPSQSLGIVVRMLASKPRRVLVIPVAAVGELIAVAGALWDTFVSKPDHAIWKRYDQGGPVRHE